MSELEAEFDIKNFQPFPTYQHKTASLIDNIVPDKNYLYWECVFRMNAMNDENRGNIIVYNGDSLNYAVKTRNISSDNGFFVQCTPTPDCFHYIVAVKSNDDIITVNSEYELETFIGHIDNIEEALLVSEINGYTYDMDTIIGGAYKERTDDYLLYLLEFSTAPLTYKSVRAILTKWGNFRILDKTTYKEDKNYWVTP
jgi:hypothetical protein